MLILIDSDLHEIGPAELDVDFEVGSDSGSGDATNDFEFDSVETDAAGIYIPGTEWGGMIEYSFASSETTMMTYRGYTWRGLLSQAVISPPSGSDYYTVSGEANAVLSEVLADVLGGFFTVPDTVTDLTISSYSFDRYTTVLAGLEKMLKQYDYRLSIHAEKETSGSAIIVYVEAVAAETVSGTFNEDSAVPLTYTDNGMGINHLICMGQGELADRTRVDLYLDEDGAVSTTQYYTGFQERQMYFDYPNAEDETELTSEGTEKLLEVASAKSLGISADGTLELEIGDSVTGVFPDGTTITVPVTKKIYSIDSGVVSVEYEVKGEF